MKLYAPSYYPAFHCIADACRHSCCVGWEIDIDDDTLSRYRAQTGAFGNRLRENITEENGCACFRLDADERCPFLNEKGLCDIIIQMGEEALSQICTDHPRFRHCFSDRTEIGLGICCEEACRLVLSWDKPNALIVVGDDGESADVLDPFEKSVLAFREELFAAACESALPIGERVARIFAMADVLLPQKTPSELVAFFSSLERLDRAWDDCLAARRSVLNDIPVQDVASSRRLENLLWYFLYRHTADAEDLVDLRLRAAFAAFSVREIYAFARGICQKNDPDAQTLADVARLYSSEIEYSEENTAEVLSLLAETLL